LRSDATHSENLEILARAEALPVKKRGILADSGSILPKKCPEMGGFSPVWFTYWLIGLIFM
jgi:hypothetical protein